MTDTEETEGTGADLQSLHARWRVTMPTAPATECKAVEVKPVDEERRAADDLSASSETAVPAGSATAADTVPNAAAIPHLLQLAQRGKLAAESSPDEAAIPLLQDVVVPGRPAREADPGEHLAAAILAELLPMLQRSLAQSLQSQARAIVAQTLKGLRPLLEEHVKAALQRTQASPEQRRGARGTDRS